jgi:GH24 family phage-related lysozyme (muramidase)
MRTILLILLLASINTMKSFKEYLIENQQIKCDVNGICKIIREYESAGNEEKILGVYKDSKGLDTIGHGHLITKNSPAIIGKAIKDPNRVSRILASQDRMTPEEAESLLRIDVESRLPTVKKLAPDFENYSQELQAELASETFRGMTGKSPKAMQHLRAGKFEEAAQEYLNAKDYRESVRDETGIAKRMKNLSDAIRMEGQRRAKSQAASKQTTQAPRSSSTSQTAPSR